MCGIAGLVSSSPIDEDRRRFLPRVRNALRHRGPDGEGLWEDPSGAAILAHSRLAILDLSDNGSQPMHSSDGRYTIVFNGEIYNYRQLAEELRKRGVQFRSGSDTEVLLELFRFHGPDALDLLDGMFALAIWDRQRRSLFLGRDPLGIKPLYVWNTHGVLGFASELRALLATELAPVKLSAPALADYLLWGSVQEPNTLVENVKLLPAGSWMKWEEGDVETQLYWKLQFGNEPISNTDAVDRTRTALDDSIRRHFVSDVPVGIFLSGGIDSTANLALARANGVNDIQTFCMSFDDEELNEGNLAARTAEHLETKHHDWRLTSREGKELLNGFLDSVDQPSNDGFNTYCVSRFARECGMKVVLSGLGGDELFGGYPSFQSVPKLVQWHNRSGWLGTLRSGGLSLVQHLSGDARVARVAAFADSKGGELAAYWTKRAFFTPHEVAELVAYYTGETHVVGNQLDTELPPQPVPGDLVSYLEMTRYMRNQLLRDSDVMSMAHGLELRVPLVDRKLVEQVGAIPSSIRHQPGKQLLLDAVPEVPHWIAKQPKRGFRFPFERWLNDGWAEEFVELNRTSPVRLGAWYRQWTLFTLNRFLSSIGQFSASTGLLNAS